MTAIEQLINLGPKSAMWLRAAGIKSVEQLRELGPVVAYRIAKGNEPRVSLNLLWALAAGLDGRDWLELDAVEKQRLRRQLEELDE